MCNGYLQELDSKIFGVQPSLIDYDRLPYRVTQTHIGVEPFFISKMSEEIICQTAELNNVSESEVLDSFIYFFLVVENTILTQQLEEYKKANSD
jgi:hypothetical protein